MPDLFPDIAIGQRLTIIADHPWQGHAGTVVAIEQIRGRGQKYPRVRLDEGPGVPPGLECYVVRPTQCSFGITAF